MQEGREKAVKADEIFFGLRRRVSTASGSERSSINKFIAEATLATARGTDLQVLVVQSPAF